MSDCSHEAQTMGFVMPENEDLSTFAVPNLS